MGVIKDNREVIFPQEDVGILGGTDRSYIARQWSELAMPAVEATFEQLPYIFEAGVEAVGTGVTDTGGSGKVYSYAASTTAQNSTNTYTFEGGDDQQAEEFDYAFVKHFNLSGDGQGALMMSADWTGREATNTTFTGALSIPTVKEIIVNNGSLYIDASGGTIGSTAVSNTLFGIDLDYTTGLQEYWAVDGSLDFSLIKFTADDIVLTLTYEHNSDTVTEKAAFRAGSTRLVRLLFNGPALTTAGTFTYKTLRLDMAGVYEDWSELQDQDGNDVVTATLRVRYSSTDSLKFEAVIVNELATLP
ncbi:MAG: hypothetical protein ACWGO1_08425 [Anaerolineales bacterium]